MTTHTLTPRIFPPFLAALIGIGMALSSTQVSAAEVRIKDLAHVEGVRDNALIGYGLVVGLSGTGDTEGAMFTKQSLISMLARLGVRVDPRQVRVRNVAAVMVTSTLPAFVRPGSKIDVAVSAVGDARSLSGGTLLMTPLAGPDGQTYMVAQGAVQVGGYDVGAGEVRRVKNQTTHGRVPAGGTVERSVKVDLSGPVRLSLKEPDFTTAQRLVTALNGALGDGAAKATDPAQVEVTPPDEFKDNPVMLLSKVESLLVDADQKARIVISERTGTVVAGADVRIRPVVISHGGLAVKVDASPVLSQPGPLSLQGQSIQDRQRTVEATEQQKEPVLVPAAATVADLQKALAAIGANPRDLVSILQAMKAAGAIDAELEVM